MGKWKPDKAKGAGNRERRARLAKAQVRKDFAKSMEGAAALAREYQAGRSITAAYTGELEARFVDWALSTYRHDKFKEEVSKAHAEMSATWGEIVATAEACAKATEARTGPKQRERRKRAAAALRGRRRADVWAFSAEDSE